MSQIIQNKINENIVHIWFNLGLIGLNDFLAKSISLCLFSSWMYFLEILYWRKSSFESVFVSLGGVFGLRFQALELVTAFIFFIFNVGVKVKRWILN